MKKIAITILLGSMFLSTTSYAASPVTLSPQEQIVQKEILRQLKAQNEKMDEIIKELKKMNEMNEKKAQNTPLEKA